MYNDKVVLITGGTGSFGQGYTRFLLDNFKPKKVIIFSRDELKQFHMQQEFAGHKNLRFFIGDVRDLPRLQRAFKGVDIVVHAAALKQIPALEYNPFEAIKTNVLGSQNVIEAAHDQGVKKVLLVSTDKAASPINLYGASKMCAEKLFSAGNVYSDNTTTAAVRYGNVIGSRGSIIDTILNLEKGKELFITHQDMTRFWITLEQCFDLVTFALKNMAGGEVFIPKAPSMKVMDIFKSLAPERKVKEIGIRPGEKIHEVLIATEEVRRTYDLEGYYAILPHDANKEILSKYKSKKKVPEDFRYTSDLNEDWLSKKHIQALAKKK